MTWATGVCSTRAACSVFRSCQPFEKECIEVYGRWVRSLPTGVHVLLCWSKVVLPCNFTIRVLHKIRQVNKTSGCNFRVLEYASKLNDDRDVSKLSKLGKRKISYT